MFPKSPARRGDNKRVVYVANVNASPFVWSRVVMPLTPNETQEQANEAVEAQPNAIRFDTPKPFTPDAITEAFDDVSTWADYNKPDNY